MATVTISGMKVALKKSAAGGNILYIYIYIYIVYRQSDSSYEMIVLALGIQSPDQRVLGVYMKPSSSSVSQDL